jgi:glycosyl transferase family 87
MGKSKDGPADMARVALGYALSIALLTSAWNIGLRVARPAYLCDLAVYWAAVRTPLEAVYSLGGLADVTHLGAALTGPFAYPPSTLLWLQPLRLAPLFPALWLWAGLGLGAYAVAARRLVDWRTVAFALITPSLVVGAAEGQVALPVAALILGAVSSKRPWVVGLLFAVAATIKPQAVLLAPVALVAAGQMRALAWSIAVGASIGLVSIAAFGFDLWLAWFDNLAAYKDVLRRLDLLKHGVTPTSLALQLGLPEISGMVLAPLGVIVVWRAFRRSSEPMVRAAALCLGCAMITPYALIYDLAVAQVFAVATLRERRLSPLSAVGSVFLLAGHLLPLGVILSAVGILLRPANEQGAISETTPAPAQA